MSMSRRWITMCDHDGCEASIIHEPIPAGDKWDYGVEANDLGWDTGPGRVETYCPEHHTPETENPPS